jgi:ABC-type nitrate/sulfonate/bicarbonate transport system permease component
MQAADPLRAVRRETSVVRAIQIAVVVIFFGLWIGLTGAHAINPLFLPSPFAVLAALARLVQAPSFWAAAGVTIASTAIAYLIASVLGIGVGFFIGRSPLLTSAYRPVLSGIFAIPITLFFPLFVVIFGIGMGSKIAFGALYGFFPIALNTIAAFAGIDQLFLRSARSQGASAWQTLRNIYLPGAWPVVLSGLRIGFFITFASVLGGETLSSVAGLGHAIAHEADLLEGPVMYAYIVIVLVVTMILNAVLAGVEQRASRR